MACAGMEMILTRVILEAFTLLNLNIRGLIHSESLDTAWWVESDDKDNSQEERSRVKNPNSNDLTP